MPKEATKKIISQHSYTFATKVRLANTQERGSAFFVKCTILAAMCAMCTLCIQFNIIYHLLLEFICGGMKFKNICTYGIIWNSKKSSKNASTKDNIQHIISFVTNTVKNVITHPTFQSLQDYTLDTITNVTFINHFTTSHSLS